MTNLLRLGAFALGLTVALIAPPTFAKAANPPVEAQVAEDATLGEIIVTANKRNEKLRDIAASITAVTSELVTKLQIINPQDFQQVAPTLNFQPADEARLFNFSIRGIGTESFSVGVEPGVATIIDGVVYTRPGAAFDGLGDIERVEVLSGPQGTLQGKNASAGAVSIITRRPNRDNIEGYGFRGKLEFEPADGVNFLLSGDITCSEILIQRCPQRVA